MSGNTLRNAATSPLLITVVLSVPRLTLKVKNIIAYQLFSGKYSAQTDEQQTHPQSRGHLRLCTVRASSLLHNNSGSRLLAVALSLCELSYWQTVAEFFPRSEGMGGIFVPVPSPCRLTADRGEECSGCEMAGDTRTMSGLAGRRIGCSR